MPPQRWLETKRFFTFTQGTTNVRLVALVGKIMLSGVSSKDILRARRMALRKRSFFACMRCKLSKSRCSDFRPCKQCVSIKSSCQNHDGSVSVCMPGAGDDATNPAYRSFQSRSRAPVAVGYIASLPISPKPPTYREYLVRDEYMYDQAFAVKDSNLIDGTCTTTNPKPNFSPVYIRSLMGKRQFCEESSAEGDLSANVALTTAANTPVPEFALNPVQVSTIQMGRTGLAHPNSSNTAIPNLGAIRASPSLPPSSTTFLPPMTTTPPRPHLLLPSLPHPRMPLPPFSLLLPPPLPPPAALISMSIATALDPGKSPPTRIVPRLPVLACSTAHCLAPTPSLAPRPPALP